MGKKLILSRELLHLAAEVGCANGMREYIQGTFTAQFPGMVLNLDLAEASFPTIEAIRLEIDGYDIEMVD